MLKGQNTSSEDPDQRTHFSRCDLYINCLLYKYVLNIYLISIKCNRTLSPNATIYVLKYCDKEKRCRPRSEDAIELLWSVSAPFGVSIYMYNIHVRSESNLRVLNILSHYWHTKTRVDNRYVTDRSLK